MNYSKHLQKLIIALSIALMAGCATVEGIGDDLETAGDKIEEATDN